MKVYIAGPMRGYENDNHASFDEAERRWRQAGHTPISPAYLARALGKGGESGNYTTEADYIRQVMIIDTTVICHCDAVAVLPGWHQSKGAIMEVALARSIGIPIYCAETAFELEVQINPDWKPNLPPAFTDPFDKLPSHYG